MLFFCVQPRSSGCRLFECTQTHIEAAQTNPGLKRRVYGGKSGESAGWQKLTHIHTLTRRHVNRDCVNSRGGEKKEKQQGEPETTPLGSPHRRPAPTCSLWLLTQLHGFTKQGSMAQPLLLHGGQNSLTPFKPNPQSTPELLHNF